MKNCHYIRQAGKCGHQQENSWKLASQVYVHIAQLIQTAIAKNIFYKDTSTRICNDHTIISKTTSDISMPILKKRKL
jgi:hypothetical protein